MWLLNERLLIDCRDFLDSAVSSLAPDPQRPALIVYHGDGDGCCAAHFLKKAIHPPRIQFYWVPTPAFDFREAEVHCLDKNAGLVVFLDLPVQNRLEMIERLAAKARVFIYDHHEVGGFEPGFKCDGVLYVNPVLLHQGVPYPTALFAWALMRKRTPQDDEVLFMGLFTESWLDRVPEIFQYLNPFRQGTLKEVAKRVHASFLVHESGTAHPALDLLALIDESPTGIGPEIFRSSEYRILEHAYGLVESEKRRLLKGILSQIHGAPSSGLILEMVESEIRVSGLIASELRWMFPGVVIAIGQRWRDRYVCELRRGAGCDVNLAELIEGIRQDARLLTGGGHPMAAAFAAEEAEFMKALEGIRRRFPRQQPSSPLAPSP
ncbi:MAG: hypothetical protein AB1512_09680 [Thermodesulfobacteriota bacterium]